MDKIGTIEFDGMSGSVGSYGYMSEDLARRGVDGHVPRIIGKRGDEFVMRTTAFFADFETASLAINYYESLSGRNTLLEYAGKQYPVFVAWKKHDGPRRILSSDSGHTHLVSCEWTLRRVQ